MAGRLEGKVAIVTGGARGIGRATVARLAEEGARVVLTDWSERRGAEAAVELAGQGLGVDFLHHDAGDEAAWARVVNETVGRHGLLHILVNNAYSGVARPFEAMGVGDLRDAMRVNLDGALCGMTLAAKAMTEGGSIINLASVAAFGGSAMNASYGAAKAALVSLTKSAAIHYGARRPQIRVNAVAPGVVHTPTLESTIRAVRRLPKDADVGPALAEFGRNLPLGRVGLPREVANAILFLASDEASYVTGDCLFVDGGMMANGAGVRSGAADDRQDSVAT